MSFEKMEPVSKDVQPEGMELEPERTPRRKEALNLLTGVFFKCVYFLDPELVKSVIVGFIKDRGNRLGIVFKGRKCAVFFSHDTFNNFAPHFNEVTKALENREKFLFTGEGFDVKVTKVFGKQHVYLYDGEHSLPLNSSEWVQFVNNLPTLYRELRNRFLQEDLIVNYIINLLDSGEKDLTAPNGLSPYLSDRLLDEVELYKRWPNGGRS